MKKTHALCSLWILVVALSQTAYSSDKQWTITRADPSSVKLSYKCSKLLILGRSGIDVQINGDDYYRTLFGHIVKPLNKGALARYLKKAEQRISEVADKHESLVVDKSVLKCVNEQDCPAVLFPYAFYSETEMGFPPALRVVLAGRPARDNSEGGGFNAYDPNDPRERAAHFAEVRAYLKAQMPFYLGIFDQHLRELSGS